MFSNLNYIHAQEHITDLMRAADQTRRAEEARELDRGRRPRLIAVVIDKLGRSKRERETVAPSEASLGASLEGPAIQRPTASPRYGAGA